MVTNRKSKNLNVGTIFHAKRGQDIVNVNNIYPLLFSNKKISDTFTWCALFFIYTIFKITQEKFPIQLQANKMN